MKITGIILSIIIMVLSLTAFYFGMQNYEKGLRGETKTVPCYDANHNEIMNQICHEKPNAIAEMIASGIAFLMGFICWVVCIWA